MRFCALLSRKKAPGLCSLTTERKTTKGDELISHASNVAMDSADCAHPRTRVEILPPGQFHFGRVVCVDCGKQLCWQPKPENAERRRQNATNIKKLLGISQLLDWEVAFCQSLSQHKLPSPKQQ